MNESINHSTEFGDIAIRAWQVLKSSWKWVTLIVIAAVAMSTLTVGAMSMLGDYVSTARNTYFDGVANYRWSDIEFMVEDAAQIATVAVVFGAIVMAVLVIISLMSMVLFNGEYQNRSVSWSEAFRIAGNRFLPVFGTMLFMLAIVIPSSFLFVGFYLAILWTFVGQVALFENKAGMDALHESEVMVRGRWWKTFFYTFVLAVICWMISGVPEALFGPAMRGAVSDYFINGVALPATYYVYLAVQAAINAKLALYTTAFSVVMYHGWKNSKRV